MNRDERQRFLEDESGHAIQYALILALVSVAILTGATVLGNGLSNLFATVIDLMPF